MAESYFCDYCLELANSLADCAAILAEQATIIGQFTDAWNNVESRAAKLRLQQIHSECEDLLIQLEHHRAEHTPSATHTET